jgi:hypothetical protein
MPDGVTLKEYMDNCVLEVLDCLAQFNKTQSIDDLKRGFDKTISNAKKINQLVGMDNNLHQQLLALPVGDRTE